MASLLFAGGVLAYEKIKDAKAKKVARKAHNAARYSDLQSSTCTCKTLGNDEKDTKGCPVHDPEMRRRTLKEEEERKREELVRGEGEKEKDKPLNHGEPSLVDTSVAGTVGGDEPPPRYEDVAAPSTGFKDRIRRKGNEDQVVR